MEVNIMNQQIKKATAICLAGIFGVTGVTVNAASDVKKEETVYVVAEADGSVRKEIVSVHLKQDDGQLEVDDSSILENIENIKGDEEPVIDGQNIHWQSDKADLFYRGTTDKELPFDLAVEYYLDEEPITAEALAGQTGHLKMVVRLTNRIKEDHQIDQQQRTIYLPMTAVTVIDLPIDRFEQVKVSAGKMVDDGKNQVITFISFPGLKESLNVENKTLRELEDKLQDELVIEAEVTDFEMNSIMTVVTPEIPEITLGDDDDQLTDVGEGVDELTSATDKLVDGSQKLYQGQQTFNKKMHQLGQAFTQLNQGAFKLSGGLAQLKEKAEMMQKAGQSLAEKSQPFGQGAIAFGQASLKWGQGAKQFGEKAGVFADGAVKLADGTTGLSEGTQKLAQATGQMASQSAELNHKMTTATAGHQKLLISGNQLVAGQGQSAKAVHDSLEAVRMLRQANPQIAELAKLEQALAQADQANQKIGQGMIDYLAKGEQLYQGYHQLNQATTSFSQGVKKLDQQVKVMAGKSQQLIPAAKQLKQGSQALTEGSNQLIAGGQALSDKSQQLAQGGEKLAAGLEQLSQGISQLTTQGIEPLHQGSLKLNRGTAELVNKKGQIEEASQALEDGQRKLNKGIRDFKYQGIDKVETELADFVSALDDAKEVKTIFEDMANQHQNFSGANSTMVQSVKYVIKTDKVKAPKKVVEINQEDNQEDEKEGGFIGWIKSLF